MKKLKIWLKIDIFGELALRHVNLLFQKTTADDDDDDSLGGDTTTLSRLYARLCHAFRVIINVIIIIPIIIFPCRVLSTGGEGVSFRHAIH